MMVCHGKDGSESKASTMVFLTTGMEYNAARSTITGGMNAKNMARF